MHARIQPRPDESTVLTKAIKNLTFELGLTQKELSLIIGPSESTISRSFKYNVSFLSPASKEGQLAILLLRLYRNLDVLFGGNRTQLQLWLRNDNEHLKAKPIHLIKSAEGLVTVIQYLDAIRGKN